MKLLTLLQSLGDRLGIIETSRPAASRQAPKVQTRAITLSELTTEIHSQEIEALAQLPDELAVSYEKIFEAAGLESGGDKWGLARLLELARSPEFRNRDRAEAQARLLETLEREKVEIETIVRDAVARDRALDAFEDSVRSKLDERRNACKRRIAELQSRIAELQAERGCLEQQMAAEEAHWEGWRSRKQSYERELADCIGYLIDEPVITTND